MAADLTTAVDAAYQAGFRGDKLVNAVAIILAESGGNPAATNSEGNNAGVDRGLFQINDYWHAEVDDETAFDPYGNAKAAFDISKGGADWSQWTTFDTGAYQANLAQAQSLVEQYNPGEGGTGTGTVEEYGNVNVGAETDDQQANEMAIAALTALSDHIAGNETAGFRLLSQPGIAAQDPAMVAAGDSQAVPDGTGFSSGLPATGNASLGSAEVGDPWSNIQAPQVADAFTPTMEGYSADNAKVDWGGATNGKHSDSVLAPIEGQEHHNARPDVARQMNAMIAAARADGVNISLTDSYRTYAEQVRVRAEKGGQVATADPGTSIHGYGAAFDINVNNERVLAWLRENAATYGFVNPPWAQKAGKSYEPWHWEYWAPYSGVGQAARSDTAQGGGAMLRYGNSPRMFDPVSGATDTYQGSGASGPTGRRPTSSAPAWRAPTTSRRTPV